MSSGLALDDAAWDSPWRRRAVRDKALLSLGLVLLALVLPTWPGTAAVAVIATSVLLGPAEVSPRLLGRCLLAPAGFVLLGAISVAVTVRWAGGPNVDVTPQSLTRAAGLVGHGLAGTLSVLVLAATTPMLDLLTALRRARVPAACVEVAALMYRLLFSLLESTRAIRDAQAARLGYGTRRATLRSAGGLAAAVLVRAWTRAARLEDGLAGRGYRDGLPTLAPTRHSSARFLLGTAALLAGTAALCLWVRATWPGVPA